MPKQFELLISPNNIYPIVLFNERDIDTMCAIMHLPPKFEMLYEKLKNVTLNNPDGFGLVTLDRGKIEVHKEYIPSGNDPETVAKFLNDSKSVDRFLHVRNNTVGANSLKNTHPFTVFNDKEGQGHRIEFMHNGTLAKYRGVTGSEESDTNNYATYYLSPLLWRFFGDKGRADISDPVLKAILEKDFEHSNRGLLISSLYGPLFLGSWVEIDNGDGTKFKASNNDYFSSVQSHRVTEAMKEKYLPPPRPVASSSGGYTGGNPSSPRSGAPTAVHSDAEGPLKEATPPMEKEATNGEKVITPLKEVNFHRIGSKKLTPVDLDGILHYAESTDEITDEELSWIAYATRPELEAFVKYSPLNAAILIERLSTRFFESFEEYSALDDNRMKIVNKHEAATKRIASLVDQNEGLQQQVEALSRRNEELTNALAVMKQEVTEIERSSRGNVRKATAVRNNNNNKKKVA